MKKSAFVKILVGLLAVAMLLTACSGNSSSQTSSQSGSGSGSGSGSSGDSKEEVELVWYTGCNKKGGLETDVAEAVSAYAKEKLNATMDIHFYAMSDYNQAVSTIITSGQYMDIVFTGAGFADFNGNAVRNAFTPLEDYIDEYLPQTKAQLPQGAWDCYTVNGHIYVVPSNKDLAARWGWLANQTMIDDLGVAFPKEFDTAHDLIPWFYDVKAARDAKYPDKKDNPIIGGPPNRMDEWYYYEGIEGSSEKSVAIVNVPGLKGYEGKGEGETVFNQYDTDEYRQAMKTVRQLVVDGIAPFDSKNFDPDKVLFNAGELLGQYPQGYVYVDEDMYAPYYKTVHYPAKNALMTTAYVQSGGNAISSASKNVERSLEFLELLNNDTYLATTIRFGPEGEGWTDNDNDGILEYGPKNPDGNRGWENWYGWFWGSITVSKYPPSYPTNFDELIKELNDNSNQDTNLGFIFTPDPVANEIAACTNVVEEYHETLKSGQVEDVDGYIDEFIKKLNDNGAQKIIDEAQKQLTEWRKSVGKPTK